jgi:hypothetical protein
VEWVARHAAADTFPRKPQRIVWDLQRMLALRSIVVCDVGAHKLRQGVP